MSSVDNSNPAPKRLSWGRIEYLGTRVLIVQDALNSSGILTESVIENDKIFMDLANLSLSHVEAHQVCNIGNEFSKKAYREGYRLSFMSQE